MAFSIGGLIKGVGSIVGAGVKGAIGASPIGAGIEAIKTLGGIVRGGSPIGKIISTPLAPLPAPRIITTTAPSMPSGGVIKSTGAAPSLPVLPTIPGTAIVKAGDVRGASPSTYSTTAHQGQTGHYSRTGRFIRTSKSGKAIRRMNPANGRAISRAARRLKSAEKMFRRVLSITHPGGMKGKKIRPKFGKRRSA